MTDKREKPFKLEMPFGEALKRYAQVKPEVIGQSDKQIRVLSRKMVTGADPRAIRSRLRPA